MSATNDIALPNSKAHLQSADQITQPTILRLPRELRDLIYEHYTRIDGGYTYDYASNKIREADGSPVSIALMLSCRQIASELRGMAFRLNPITFSTYVSESTRQNAGIFHSTLSSVSIRKKAIVRSLIPRLLTQKMAQEASQAFPKFAPLFDGWQPGSHIDALLDSEFTGGEAPSAWEDFMQLIFDLLSEHPRFFEVVKAIPRYWTRPDGCNVFELRDARPEPWSIPESIELQRLADTVEIEPQKPKSGTGTNYCYSAVHVALRFLHSIPTTTREMIRKVILLEDRPSVARPQCHGRGLVILCQAHQHIRFERIVGLWRNAFPVSPGAVRKYIWGIRNGDNVDTLRDDRLVSATISHAIASWMAEALALPSFGMPIGSYSHVFEGAPNPELASRVFQVVQRDAAWQGALDAAYTNGMLPRRSWSYRRLHTGYITECFPDVVRNLSAKDASVRCNFDLGISCDVDKLLQDHHGWSDEEWETQWSAHEPADYQTESPLPPWHILRWSYVFSRS